MSSRAKKKIRRPVVQPTQTQRDVMRMYRHGITPEDLARVDKESFDRGFEQGKLFVLKDCYAAAALAFRDMTGQTDKSVLCAFLQKIDHAVTYALTSGEIIDRVSDELGIVMDFKETFPEDRITEIEQ